MSELFNKFVIVSDDEIGDCLIIAKCTYHKELVTDKNTVKGGGWWTLKDKTFTFTGDSHDFGKAKLEDIKKCIENGNVFTNKYLTHSIHDKFQFLYDIGSEIIKIK